MPSSGPDCRPQVKLLNGKCFKINCGFYNAGHVLASTHAGNVFACTRACSKITNCIYAVFDRGTGQCDSLDSTSMGDKKNTGYDLGELTALDQCG